MKILAIRLKNLTSIEGTVEVDFTQEPLRSAGIFAISGPTGAGKSTILDALCLALYDKAPRFANSVENISLVDVGENQISQADVKNLLRRGMGDGYAEVDFQGVTGETFRSRWSVHRTKYKSDGSLRNQTIEVWNLDKNEELQGNRKELLARLVDLTGLTYEQFTRTVLLAQNDFATFLKSRGTAKAELLEKLTGTNIYSRISQEVFARNKSALEEVNLVRSKMSVIELLPEEVFQELLKEKQEQGERRVRGIKELADLNAQWNILRSLKTQEELLAKKQQEELSEIEKRKTCIEALTLQEEKYAHFKAQWEAIQPDLKKARQLDTLILVQREAFDRAEQLLKTSKAQVKEQLRKWNAASMDLQSACRALQQHLKISANEAFQLDQIELFLHQEEARLADMQKVSDEQLIVLNEFGYPSLVEEQSQTQKELTLLQNIRQLKADSGRAQVEIVRLEKEHSELIQELAAKEGELKTLQRLYDNARMTIGQDVKALRQQLQEGEACPVCGSKSHPYHIEEIVDTLYKGIEKEYTESATLYQQINNRSITVRSDLNHLKQLAEQYESQLLALQKAMPAEADEDKINFRLKELETKIHTYHQLHGEWQQKDEALKKMRLHCDLLRENVTQCRLMTQKEIAMKEQLLLLQAAENSEQQRFLSLSEELEKLRLERSGLLKGKSADESEAAIVRRDKELAAALEHDKKEVEQVQIRILGLQGEIRQLTLTIRELMVQKENMKTPDLLPEMIEKQQEENLNTERLLSSIEARILQQEKNKIALERIVKELEEKERISEQWAKLNKLIGSADGAKFKVIAQSYTLNLLLFHANHHLSYLSRRYRLQQVPDTLALQVVDGEMCDEVRTVYSLSGGESFLISLALALGLSSLSSNNLKVESLFIDEGFGSLDADSLRTAMEALEQLQMQGRKIGVISHVQEMSERISVQVRIQKKVNGKSVLTVAG